MPPLRVAFQLLALCLAPRPAAAAETSGSSSAASARQQLQVWELEVSRIEGAQCGRCWEMVQGSSADLPSHDGRGFSVDASPYQASIGVWCFCVVQGPTLWLVLCPCLCSTPNGWCFLDRLQPTERARRAQQ